MIKKVLYCGPRRLAGAVRRAVAAAVHVRDGPLPAASGRRHVPGRPPPAAPPRQRQGPLMPPRPDPTASRPGRFINGLRGQNETRNR